MKIIYVGPLNKGGTCLQRMMAMQDLSYAVTSLDTEPPNVKKKQSQLFYRARRKFFGPSDLAHINEKILKLLKEDNYHLLWIDKGLTLTPETLQTVKQMYKKTIIAGYSPDDMLNPTNQSRQFLNGLPYYDIYITTKSYNVSELKNLGCKEVLFIENAYDPKTHRPLTISKEDKIKFGGQVGFIGGWEREREKSILFLSDKGIPVRVWGEGWPRKLNSKTNLKIENKPLFGDNYAKAICSFDINLCFLRKINRDLQTTRSIEIPACGGFMLAERTNEHLSLFKEGLEAEFFSSNDELLSKVKHYLLHDNERKSIALRGYERCMNNGYSNHARMSKNFDCIRSAFNM